MVQKHDASRLHYDFRLELDGVLKSWAVPKGPSRDPDQRRLAVHVEDHPLEYGSFEGIIPEGEYGAGTVLLWDRGEWIPDEDPRAGYRNGKLSFTLKGERLRGSWTLVRMDDGEEEGKNWLLIKHRDHAARSAGTEASPSSARKGREDEVGRVADPAGANERDLLERHIDSVVSGRSLEEIASDRDRVWRSSEARGGSRPGISAPGAEDRTERASPPDAASLPGARRARVTERVEPQLATSFESAPDGDDWLHEIKFDGYRIICRVVEGRARLLSRSGKDWTDRFGALARAVEQLPGQPLLLDGEVVHLEPDGRTSFQSLQKAIGEGRDGDLSYFVFDLLHLGEHDLREAPLEGRKEALEQLFLAAGTTGRLRFIEHITGRGPAFLRQACRFALEGIVSKRRDRPYRSGRGRDWRKIKCVERETFVVGGYTAPSGARAGFGSLLLGGWDDDGALRYCGRVGTGFDEATLASLHGRLEELRRRTSPFADFPDSSRDVTWVDPETTVEVEFTEWTEDGVLRHPSFKGERDDISVEEASWVPPTARDRGGATRGEKGGEAPDSRAGGEKPSGEPAPSSGGREAVENEVAGVRLSHPDRILYPERGLTKKGLAVHYVETAELILPHIRNRPLALVRCPRGHTEECFFQKHFNESVSEEVRPVPIEGTSETYLMIDSLPGLISLVQMSTLEIHPWGARTDRLDRPDRIIFDLDPGPSVDWSRVVDAARELHDRLEALGLRSFLKTTGGKGLHLVVPVDRRHGWDEIKGFAEALARELAREHPDRYTASMSKKKREGKIFVDYLRNTRGATAVAPYSTRARPGAPVSVPLAWSELGEGLRPERYTVGDLSRRLSRLGADPWAELFSLRQSITKRVRSELGLEDP